MTSAVLFDLDGTLLDRRTSIREFVAGQYRRLRHHLTHVAEYAYIERFLALDNNGYTARNILFENLVREFDIERMRSDDLLSDFRAHFPQCCTAFRGAHATLRAIRERGLGLGLITNGSGDGQQRKLLQLGLADAFDTVLISEVEGVKKPDAAIFGRALTRLGVPAEESIFVGDHPILDIQGGRAVGMRALWKRNDAWPVPEDADGIIDDLHEVLAFC